MPAKTWQQNMLGITFRYADGRITVFRSTLESIGRLLLCKKIEKTLILK